MHIDKCQFPVDFLNFILYIVTPNIHRHEKTIDIVSGCVPYRMFVGYSGCSPVFADTQQRVWIMEQYGKLPGTAGL